MKDGTDILNERIAELEAEVQKYVDTIEAFAEYFNIGCWVLDKGKLDITFTDKEDAVEWYDRMQLINENAALREQLAAKDEALRLAYMGIMDYLEYEFNDDPWSENPALMGEMELNEMARDGRLEKIKAAM